MNQIQADLQRFKKDTAYYEAHHEELAPETVGVFSDLMTAALGSINWQEIAESMLGDLEDED